MVLPTEVQEYQQRLIAMQIAQPYNSTIRYSQPMYGLELCWPDLDGCGGAVGGTSVGTNAIVVLLADTILVRNFVVVV